MKLLHIDSSIFDEPASASRQITRTVVERFRRVNPTLEVITRDLANTPLPHLSQADLAAGRQPLVALDDQTRARVSADSAVLQEFLEADVIVVGAPMYNLGIPSVLKAWIDRISIAGKTFRYTAQGPEGLAGGKRAVIASSRGGVYSQGSLYASLDFQENYLRAVFGFLGVADVQVVRAEGLNLGPEHREAAMSAAIGEVTRRAA